MFKFLAKTAIASLLWTRYRNLIISTLLLFLFYFIVTFIHDDYLEYARLANTKVYVAASYFLKWGLLLASTAIYYFINIHKRTLTKSPPTQAPFQQAPEEINTKQSHNDPFDQIRKKDKLKSKADLALKE